METIQWIPLFLSLVLFSCTDNDNSPDKEIEQALNPKVEGKIFIGNKVNGGWILDLDTGHYSKIPNTDWDENPNYPGLASFSAAALYYGNGEFVETIENCVVEFGNDKDCIVFHNNDGNINGSFQISDIALGTARLSLDGTSVAITVENEGNPFKILHVYNRSGELMRVFDKRKINSDDFSWTTSNQIVYISGQSIYVSNSDVPIITFRDEGIIPGEPSISPDGTQVVFTLGEDTSQGVEGTIWLINIDGTGLRQLTTKEMDLPVTPSHKSAIWSPDGQWVFVVDGTSIEGNAYVVPADAQKVELTQKRNTLAVPVLSYFRETFEFQDNDPISLSSQFGVNYGEIYWLP
ncbi:TolB family protein [Aquimarina algiphila]|uniref:TolB family protein n=1 Tax=Aquimarina algiphila TaxID=2047982 RepID=UPI00232CCEEB|nr:hypothetical protein [Aquimarina algiphila]